MRKVLKNIQEVAHYWSNQVQSEGKASSLFFEGNTIYSYGYHFPIATIHNGKVLFTVRGYSPSTAKHIRVVSSANWRETIYCFNPFESARGFHEGTFNYWKTECKLIVEKLAKATKPEKYILELSRIQEQYKKYSEFLNCSNNDLEAIFAQYLNEESQGEAIKAAKEKAKEKAKKEKEEFLEDLNKWQNFEIGHLYRKNGHDYLRYNKEKERVETTQGVEIPKQIARILWDKVKSNSLQVGDQVLHYTVRSVGKTIEIGCHSFPKSYLVEFGEGIF